MNRAHYAVKNQDGSHWVKKIPKDATSNPRMRSKAWVTISVKLMELSRGMTRLYTKMIEEEHKEKVEIDFAKGKGVKDGSGLLPPGSYTYYEEFISEKYSEWTKWCNNYTFFDQSLMKEHPHIPALVHFIYTETKGTFTILDVQGKFAKPGGQYKYVLSDPAFVSTMNGTFGPTDFGKAAMKKFFDKHTCNKYCQHLERPTGAIPDLAPA